MLLARYLPVAIAITMSLVFLYRYNCYYTYEYRYPYKLKYMHGTTQSSYASFFVVMGVFTFVRGTD